MLPQCTLMSLSLFKAYQKLFSGCFSSGVVSQHGALLSLTYGTAGANNTLLRW